MVQKMKTMICLDNLSYSEFNHFAMLDINNTVLDSNEEISISALDQSFPLMNINTAVFPPVEMDSFNDGVLLVNTIENAQYILGCSNNSKKVLYLYDLDWMFKPLLYDDVYDVLTNKDLTIILRSEDYIQPIKNLCGITFDKIMNRFTLEGLWNLL